MNDNEDISLLMGLISFSEEYREFGIGKTKDEANKIETEMVVDPKF